MPTIAALYCHIPFCHTICPFCAFAVHGNRAGLHQSYLDALKAEIVRAGQEFDGPGQRINTLYFGGGTPSTLSIASVLELLGVISDIFPFSSDIEIAFEVNPEDSSGDYLKALCHAGINRVSLGLQSLDNATLKILGRNHDAETGRKALQAVQESGPDNYNIDLMFGMPNAPPGAFQRDLEAVQAFHPQHISLYGLDLEPGTLFFRDPEVQSWMELHGAAEAGKYLHASKYMTGLGYRHYEVSNFCQPGREGRQNLAVWAGENYLGFGTGAHSCYEGVRWHNHRHLRAYLRATQQGDSPSAFREALTATQMANEALMLALRQDTGLDIGAWEARWSTSWRGKREAISKQLVKEGRACWSEGRLALTPRGFLVADEATEQLMVE